MQAFLRELEREKTVSKISLPGCKEPERWISTEEAELYRSAFASEAADAEKSQQAAAIILQRFLDSHALIGLDDVLQRYPFERGWAERQLADWTRKGRLVRVISSEAEPLQWSAPENFEQLQRSTLSILRREVMTCPAPQFADFVLRWQHLHPATQATSLGEIMPRLQASLLPTELWEQSILRLRCRSYLPRHLDELIAAGHWTWYGQGISEGSAATLAFAERETLALLPPPSNEDAALDQAAVSILEVLRNRGALFTAELAAQTKLSVSSARVSLWSLLRMGLVTNDQFDLLRRGEPPRDDQPPPMRSSAEVRAYLRGSRRRQEKIWPEGRWSRLAWGESDREASALLHARLLLDRYGIVARELANMSGLATPWRILYEILSRLELAGDVRRGYFVEGLSGAQFALPEAAKALHEIALPSNALAPTLLVNSLDPANLYGSGAAFEIPMATQDARTFQRRPGNWLVIKAGRPLLLIEQQGKRLTSLPTASSDELAQAVGRLPDLLKLVPNRDVRHKLTVEMWNEQPVTGSLGKELLEQVGFVRDYQAMTLYAVWQTGSMLSS